ncbi:MAG: dynamin family protein [Bacteroidales bacterium]|nr:dynamin family protein [Bacteroidales bacterium]
MEKDIDLYAAFFKAKKDFAKKADEDRIAGEDYKMLESYFDDCRPIVAEQIYAICSRIDNMLEMLPSTMREKCGIKTQNKPSIFLTGEFSGGKTTLIHELAGHKSGSESGGPETASIVIHKCAKESNCEVFFEPQFYIENSAEFRKKLNKSRIDVSSNFIITGNTWTYIKEQEPIENSDWNISETQEFISEMADFPNAIKKIVWTHSECPTFSPLNYASLCDMPGTGGKESHDSVINKIFDAEKPDIICYVIDTDQGISCSTSEESRQSILHIKALAEKCFKEDIMFFWLYSKPTNDKEQEYVGECEQEKYWLDEKRKNLDDFIDKIFTLQKNESDAHTENPTQETYEETRVLVNLLKQAPIIDARNKFTESTDNTSHAMNALAIIIQQYYIKILERYTDQLNNKTSEYQDSKVFKKIIESQKDDYPDMMTKIFESIYDNKKLNLKDLKAVKDEIKKALFMDSNDQVLNNNKKVQKYVENIRRKIDWSIGQLLTRYTPWNSNTEIDLNKFYNYKVDLEDETNNDNLVFFDAQVYHWFKMFYSNQITDLYTHEFSNTLFHKLNAILKELKEYKTNIMYILK